MMLVVFLYFGLLPLSMPCSLRSHRACGDAGPRAAARQQPLLGNRSFEQPVDAAGRRFQISSHAQNGSAAGGPGAPVPGRVSPTTLCPEWCFSTWN